MKLLVDQNLPLALAEILRAAGHEVEHTSDVGLERAVDPDVASHARERGQTIVTSDTDFGSLLAADRAASPSVILTRELGLMPADQMSALILQAIDLADNELQAGAIVAVGPKDIRVRLLPLR